MVNFDKSFSVNRHGISLHDEVALWGGVSDPNEEFGNETYPVGSKYFRNNGSTYTKTSVNWKLDEISTSSIITISIINSVTTPTFYDSYRSKLLSVTSIVYVWSEEKVNNREWFQIGSAIDSLSGYIMPFDGTVIGITAHCVDLKGNTNDIQLYINDNSIDLGILSGTNEGIIINNFIDEDFVQGDKLRIKAGSGGVIDDTVITLLVKWRA